MAKGGHNRMRYVKVNYYDRLKLEKQLKENRKAKPVFTTDSRVNTTLIIRRARQEFADQLNRNLPKSEIWFNGLYTDRDINDFFNKPLGNFIPDLSNYRYSYVVEIDGSIHDLEHIKQRDRVKDSYYRKCGYKVIRVKAYNIQDFTRMMYILRVIRKQLITKKHKFDTQESIDEYMAKLTPTSN